MRFTENVLHENSDLLMKFRKEDEKYALPTEQNECQVLFCTVTSRLLHDDAKIHAKYFDPDRRLSDFILYFNTLRLDLHSA